ncbi:MAG TPA: glycosyltransferase family 4 protein, partial [Candidatus Limnocylindrales bacterium]
VSHAIERELLDSDVRPERITYLPHAIDVTRFAPVTDAGRRALRLSLGLPPNATTAVFVGRLSREKGLMELMEAWTDLAAPGVYLVVVGPDMPGHPWDVGPAARALVAERGLSSSVRFVGGVSPNEVPKWMQAADLAVQPSHFEAFGIAAAEAMAIGLPVVASDVGGFRDYIQDGINGFRVPPHDPQALGQALRRLLCNDELRRLIGQAARVTALQFDERHVLEAFAQLLDRLTEHGSLAGGPQATSPP